MVFDVENRYLVMHLSTLIKRYCITKENEPSHLPTIFGEKYEVALLGFIKLALNEQEACGFSEDFLRD